MAVHKIISFYFMTLILIAILLSVSGFDLKNRNDCVKERDPIGKTSEKTYNSRTQFFLFTPKNKEKAELLHKSCKKLPHDSNFDEKLPTIIIIHGFQDGVCRHSWMREMKEELFKRDNFNVILVDWADLAGGDLYAAQVGIRKIAKDVGKLINNIKKKKNIPAESIHVIGHSFGGQMSSFITKYTKVGRISALDPAGLASHNVTSEYRLDITDADLIDVYHTSAGRCLPYCGYLYPVGTADFYIGNGRLQPSCYVNALEAILKMNPEIGIVSLIMPSACAHLFVTDFFKVTINPSKCQYIGNPCKNYEDALNKKCEKDCNENNKNCAKFGFDWSPKDTKKINESLVYQVDMELLCPYCTPGDRAASVSKP